MLDDARLGRILVESGKVSKEALQAAIDEQKRSPAPRRLSEILLERGVVSDADLRNATDHAAQYEPTAVVSPKTLGKFRIDAELGRGGMGVVYRAWQADLERTVALKMLPLTADAALKERFLREARTASKLKHPNIVSVHELGEHEGAAFFTMDFVRGEGFDAVLRRPERTLEENLRVIATVARALDYAHGQGVVHRDIKPANILVASDGTPFLTDFGLARNVNLDASLTASGQILGTPAFMSPEQARGRGEIGPSSDLYSLGAVLYVALAGTVPFSGDSVYELLDAIVKRTPEPPRKRRPDLPESLEAVCLRCLEKDPARRYPSARRLADDLERFLSGRPVVPPGPLPPRLGTTWASKYPRRLRLIRRTLAAVGMAALAGIATWAILAAVRPDPSTSVTVPDTPTAGGRRWSYRFASAAELADWPVEPAVARTNQSWSIHREAGRLFLRGIELRFRIPLEGEGAIEAELDRLDPNGAAGLAFGGYKVLREGGQVTLRSPSNRTTSKPAPETRGRERIRFALQEDSAVVSIDGKEVLREPLREPARPLHPAVFVPEGAALECGEVQVEGRPRAGWPEEQKRERALFQEVGRKYGFGPPLNLLEGGESGRFRAYGSGTRKRTADEIQISGIAGTAAELHGPDHRNARIRFQYRTEPGASYFGLRFRAGFRDVTVPLPADAPGKWKSVEVIALEHEFRCILDGTFDVRSSQANGVEFDQPMLRFKVSGGGFAIRAATVEPIRDVPPQEPWTILFREGTESPELVRNGTWEIKPPHLTGSGILKTAASHEELDAEIILTPGRAGAKLRFGLSPRTLIETDAAPAEGGFTVRLRKGEIVVENADSYRRETVPPGLSGPFTIETVGAPFSFFAIRLRKP